MAIDSTKLVKFGYGFDASTSTTVGMISFDASAQAIYVGDGNTANLVTSSVKDATFEENVLTITKIDNNKITLNFTDVASAKETMAIFTLLDSSIKSLDGSIKSLDTRITNLDAYVDSSINAINAKIGEVTEGKTVVGLIEEAKNAANAAHSVVAKDSSFLTLNSSTADNGAVTYTLGTSDIASATELTTHTSNNDIHITAQERTDWNAAKSAIDTFLKDASLTGEVIDTLTEIQDYIASDASAADKLVKDLSDVSARAEKGVSDAATAQAAADKAQGEVDALEGDVSTLRGDFNTHNVNGDIHVTADDKVKWNAAEKNAKDYADGLASNYDKVGDASKAETAAKEYADAITVNGQAQSSQEITLTGVNITVGGTGTHSESNIDAAIEDLYTQVQAASEAGVQSLAVNTDSSAYAEVSKSTGAITLTIKKVALAAATSTNTGVADAWDVKESIRLAKEGVIGAEGDAADASTIAGAKAYADAQIAANALKWSVLP